MNDQIELLRRRIDRERLARKEAEKIIEEKSRELYAKTQELEQTAAAERQARQEAEILREGLEAFASTFDMQGVLVQLGGFLQKIIPHEDSSIFLIEGDHLCLRHVQENSTIGNLGDRFPLSYLPVDLERQSQPFLVTDFQNGLKNLPWGTYQDHSVWMVVPIAGRGRSTGCIFLKAGPTHPFDLTKAKLVQAMTHEAAIALENARLFKEVERLSNIDSLTGLHNRRYFDLSARIEFERAHRHHFPLSVVMMDLDYFKQINDRYGHAAGDQVLIETAAVCRRDLRKSDIKARYGGEEFCLVFPETNLEGAHFLSERIRASIGGLLFEFNNLKFKVTASLGVAEKEEGEDSIDTLIKRSDEALYEAKHGGRNRVVVKKGGG
jgi:diguanylate cyclase (GGDEF)-like protein